MRYRLFGKAGDPIGSGAVESACKHVVQQRLKQYAVLALRSTLLSQPDLTPLALLGQS